MRSALAGAAVLGAVALAGCGGSSTPAARTASTPNAGKVPVASLGPELEPCVEQWNSPANQSVRFGFDGEVLDARNTVDQKMLVTRTAGRCSLVFPGAGTDQPRIWSREAGIWSAQAVLAGETALTAEVRLAQTHPNVTAAITDPPDEEDTTVGLLVPLPAAG
ncbi:MAG TPA: hypothetical protein VHW26_00405 [Solirubrobacteraceae bacterium]|nr:hypothetical protein [Solirubrobacteraceae bacterium]